MPDKRPLLGLPALWLAWGSSFFAIRVMVRSIPPMLGAGVAFCAAGVVLAVATAIRGQARLDWAGLRSATSGGLLMLVGGQGLLTVAEQHLASSTAAVVVAAVPLWLVLLRFLVGDRPGWGGTSRAAVGFLGVAVLLLGSSTTGGGTPTALVLAVLATVSWALGSFFGARSRDTRTPVMVTTAVQILVGGVVLVVLGASVGPPLDPAGVTTTSVLGLGYLAVMDSLVGFLLYQWLLRELPINLASTYAFAVPVIAVALGVVLLDEPFGVLECFGAALVVVSVAAETRARS